MDDLGREDRRRFGRSEILTIFFGMIGQLARDEIFDHFWAVSERIGQIIYIGK